MKKLMLVAALCAVAGIMTGCGSLRTPDGARKDKVWYNTFFGLSVESAVWGDGIIPGSTVK